MNIDELVDIVHNSTALEELKRQYAGDKFSVYCPKTEDRRAKGKIKEQIKKAFKNGVTIKSLAITFSLSKDTIRRYLGKKK